MLSRQAIISIIVIVSVILVSWLLRFVLARQRAERERRANENLPGVELRGGGATIAYHHFPGPPPPPQLYAQQNTTQISHFGPPHGMQPIFNPPNIIAPPPNTAINTNAHVNANTNFNFNFNTNANTTPGANANTDTVLPNRNININTNDTNTAPIAHTQAGVLLTRMQRVQQLMIELHRLTTLTQGAVASDTAEEARILEIKEEIKKLTEQPAGTGGDVSAGANPSVGVVGASGGGREIAPPSYDDVVDAILSEGTGRGTGAVSRSGVVSGRTA